MPDAEEQHTCPRRMYEIGPWEHAENLDTWRAEAVGPCCNFCGSLHPDRFMELAEQGWIVGPTDKPYKAYLHRPLSAAEAAERKAAWLGGFKPEEVAAAAEERGEDVAQTQAGLESHYDAHLAATEVSGTEAKFYYQHLSEQQRARFIELHNSHQMKVGYPGYFYQPPFFAVPAQPSQSDAQGATP